MEQVELTPKQKQQWGDTMSMMAWTAPGFRHLWYKLLTNHEGDYCAIMTKENNPTACTDGKNIMVNPDFFFGLTVAERVFVSAHEVVHNVYGDVELLNRCEQSGRVPMHDGTSIKFDEKAFQHSMDYRINALLVDSKIGKLPDKALYDPKISGPNDSVLDVYRKVYKKQKEDKENGNGDGSGSGGQQAFDKLLPPGKSTGQSPSQAAAQRNPQQWAMELATAQTLEQIKSQGNISGALKRMFQEILEPEIPWTEHIRGLFARRLGSGGYNWRRPDRRFIVRDLYLPSRSGHGAGWVVCWGDTSGSMGAKELDKNMGELGGIVEDVRPRRLTVLWCDSAIKFVDELEDGSDLQRVRCRGVGGGGGTSVHPVFDWIKQNAFEAPDMFVGFTDGYVTFPKHAPTFPVIWCSTTDVEYPWGDVVRLKK